MGLDILRKQVGNLIAEIEIKNRMNQDSDGTDLSKHKDSIERERDRLVNEVSQLNTNFALSYQEELERKTSVPDLKINEIEALLEDQTKESNREKRVKEKF